MGKGSTVRTTVVWLFGPAVWAAHFFLLYGIAGFTCLPLDAVRQGQIRLLALSLTVIALLVLVGFLARQSLGIRRPGDRLTESLTTFLARTANVLALLAILGVIWTVAGTMMIPACVSAAG
ncbi:MAG: hypothetical protein ACRECO_04030 [Xanthobacteraceae bacterium]